MFNAVLTCSEYFTELALNELRRYHPQLVVSQQLSPQHLLLTTDCSFDRFTRPWRRHLPIYLHHVFPVQTTLSLHGNRADFDLLRKHAAKHYRGDFTVQARIVGKPPYSAVDIQTAIKPTQNKITKPDGRVLSVLVVDGCCYIGMSWASQNLSAWATGRSYFSEPMPNRAGLKLFEALDAFQIRLREGDHALDLGAAPGAWTEVLRRRRMRVTAVAPTEMYDWLQADAGVRIFTTTAEDYLTRCDTTYDLIVNDMKLDAQDSARLMVAYARHLRPNGIAVMTLKLRLRNTTRVMDHALRLLRKEYKIIRVRQLVSNRKEVTLFLRRKSS